MKPERCPWAEKDELYRRYHDEEWGRPVHDDRKLFEFLLLESFQAGLSWHTILKKRENFRRAFDDFDCQKVAGYEETKVGELMENEGIIRNRLKIKAAIRNAQQFLRIQDEFGSFSKYIWAFVDGKTLVNIHRSMAEVPASTEISDRLSKDLKKRGFTFVGTTIMYAFMQAIGMVDDHLVNCPCKKKAGAEAGK
ncbi:DNA-3-methyladenine glycosylase I [Chryseobacterium salipaludis]|uniref:DNA-3-methyladenine glycosylase I n=1 Tax=Chryseobacterium TaxID=59732 RepID=UPI001FF4C2F4|nr:MULTISPECIES: DNA-3-methyladenine glycosylase I [Chryseobacterium]MCJ8497237.1 DNA-3-methyladenine glycosylase I [Chryseobacterium salipaludis]MCX3295644.1 DNA-3-methyladenine glycosylase I [Planobacterium sp. JC490]